MTRITKNNSWTLWEGRVKKVLHGKPAQKYFIALEQALLDLPQKRLIAGDLCNGLDVCAVGALALHEKRLSGVPMLKALIELKGLNAYISHSASGEFLIEQESETALWYANDLGMTPTLAWLIVEANDELAGWKLSPEERYEFMLRWARARIFTTKLKDSPL